LDAFTCYKARWIDVMFTVVLKAWLFNKTPLYSITVLNNSIYFKYYVISIVKTSYWFCYKLLILLQKKTCLNDVWRKGRCISLMWSIRCFPCFFLRNEDSDNYLRMMYHLTNGFSVFMSIFLGNVQIYSSLRKTDVLFLVLLNPW
jgi:hypothetical protein